VTRPEDGTLQKYGSIPGRRMIFSIPGRVQTSSGAHPTFSGYFRLSLRVEWPGHEADHSTPSMELYLHTHKFHFI